VARGGGGGRAAARVGGAAMSAWPRLAELPLEVEGYRLEARELRVPFGFHRRTTVVRLEGAGADGRGEDVTYSGAEQLAHLERGAVLPLAGRGTLGDFSARLDALELWPLPPEQAAARHYRRWAYESAALDLALRQAGRSLAGVLGRVPEPVRFCVSLGLGEPPSTAPLRALLGRRPSLTFKLDAGRGWTDALVAELAALATVETVDLKGAYRGTPVDLAPDPALYRRVVEGFPEAWIEDPALTPATADVLAGALDRVTWDAPIHSRADVEALAHRPRTINVKPSRCGTLERLFELYAFLERESIAAYGGGQFELDCGRGQVQLLASLFHADAPNDVAPTPYHAPERAAALPASPLPAAPDAPGFRWASG